ncbi:hypothetical protein INR49_005835 [Caranx melampygus]|nr:hypothetical protein INR49_005835 [Caranx melampygus]
MMSIDSLMCEAVTTRGATTPPPYVLTHVPGSHTSTRDVAALLVTCEMEPGAVAENRGQTGRHPPQPPGRCRSSYRTPPETLGRMNSNQEEDEFVAVRVQDPRVQNEGSWNSYVDYKIFLHTSCVRRRYSEFVWLKKKLQKNAGLVPVPDLPGKSFFSFSNEDFLERRRKGLQAFLDKVVNTTVCLSDSQLHLFLQTQLPVGHIQDCVQGHTPYSVTDAILTYASSNWGFAQAQAQEDDAIKEPSLTVSYESMESPAPHQPCLQITQTSCPELLSCGDSDPLEDLLDTAVIPHKDRPSVRISQENNHLEAVSECDCAPAEASFFLGDQPENLSPAEPSQQRSCQIQTPVEVHSPMGTGFEDCERVFEEEETVEVSEMEVNLEKDSCVNSVAVLDLKISEEQGLEGDTRSQEDVVEVVSCEVNGVNHVCSTEGEASDISCVDESDEQNSENRETSPQEEDRGDAVQQVDQKEADESDSHSLPSSNGSIVKVSEEEEEDDSVYEEAEDSLQDANGFVKTSPEDVSLCRTILDLHMNGCTVEKEDVLAQEDEDLQHMTSVDLNSTVAAGDLTENSDFSVLETSSVVMAAAPESNHAEQELLSSLSLDGSEEVLG